MSSGQPMGIRRTFVDAITLGDGRPGVVEAYTLESGTGYSATVWTYGATLVEFMVPGQDGIAVNAVQRLPDLASYRQRTCNPYLGATIGRFCRIVAGAQFALDGVAYCLDRNDGRHHIHGGSAGFDQRIWRASPRRDAAQVSVELSLTSPHGDQGYPGEVTTMAAYRLHRSGRLVMEYAATTTAPTIIGLTNHAYWNLAGAGTIDNHYLTVGASRFLAFNDDLVPLDGPPVPAASSGLDFRQARRIGSAQLDNYLVFDAATPTAILSDPASGRAMRITTDQAGIGVYSGERLMTPRAGLCLEAGPWPDAPNRADAPPARLDPGSVYRHRTVHEFFAVSQIP